MFIQQTHLSYEAKLIGISTFKLRLRGELDGVEFQSTPSSLKRDVVTAFTQYLSKRLGKNANLEVFHPVHGWQNVCLENTYLLIGSPILIDYQALLMGVYETYSLCDKWPSQDQLRHRKALARRRAFYVVKG